MTAVASSRGDVASPDREIEGGAPGSGLPAERPSVAYIVSRFPKTTETFVLFEILAVESQGIDVQVHPLLREHGPIVHPEAEDLVRRADYGPLLSPAVVASNVRMATRRPRRYAGALAAVLRGTLGSRNFLLGGLAVFPRAVQLAERLEAEGIGHVHCHFANHPTLVGFVVGRLTGIPYSFTAHAFDIHVDRHMLREKVAEAAFVIPISSDNERLILETTGGRGADRIEVIHCGVDTEIFHPGDRLGRVSPAPRLEVLCVGSLTPLKGQANLIEACRRLAAAGLDVRTRIVGDGPERGDLEQRIRAADVGSSVQLLGARDRASIARLHREVDILVAPSTPTRDGKREGIPVVLMEAMASGLPVVASRLSGIPELVEDGVTGLLVPPGDIEALTDAIRRLGADPALRRRMGAAGRAKVLQEFNLRRSAARLAERFRVSVASSRGVPSARRAIPVDAGSSAPTT